MWDVLKQQAGRVTARPILDLFDDARADDFAVKTQFMRFDYAKTNIDAPTRALLLALAEASGVAARRDAMFAGEKINETEGRAVLHTALRNLDGGPVMVDGRDVMHGVLETLDRMATYATEVLEALGLQRCPFHLELIMDDTGPCVVDLGARLPSEAGGDQFFGEFFGEGFGVSALAPEEDGDTPPCHHRFGRGGGVALSGEHPGEEAVEPLPLFGGEGCGFGDVGR